MIKLLRIYSKPLGLFDLVEFHDGINIIYGEKGEKNKQQDSLNGIGKSTLLDLINFCLLSNLPPRLNKAKKFLDDYTIILEFENKNTRYSIERGTKKRSEVKFSVGNDERKYKIEELKIILCDLFYKDEKYEGYYSNEWFRKLTPFFIKIQQKGKQTYKDVLTYLEGAKLIEVIQYHIFLLGLDPILAKNNYQLKTELTNRQNASKEIKKFIQERYNLNDVQDANNSISIIQKDIKKLVDSIEVYKLQPHYEEVENKANELTKRINQYVFEMHRNKRRINDYQKSLELNIEVNPNEVSKIYSDLNKELGIAIKTTLNEAIQFKKKLVESRKNFISDEIRLLRAELEKKEQEINTLDNERSMLFSFLEEKEAIKDLTTAFSIVNQKREQVNDLSAKLQTYNDFQKEILDIKEHEVSLKKNIVAFIENVNEKIDNFRDVYNNIYNAVYVKQKDKAIFNIGYNFSTDAKFDIKIDSPDIFSEGKNRGCILIYDLSVLINAIMSMRLMPRFLIHDGIFDGIHKSHFVALMNYLENLDYEYQYIFTANKEDIFMKEAVNCGELNFDIEKKSIAVFSPTNKLFKRDF